MTVRLRAHHLLCLQTYVGEGYSPDFVANYDTVVARLAAGEAVELVDGPDAICAPLADDPRAHCRLPRIVERDRRARLSVGATLGRRLVTGDRLVLDAPTLRALRARFAAGRGRAACAACRWNGLCTAVAADGFADARL